MSTHTSPAPPTLSPPGTPATVLGIGRPGLTFPLAKDAHIKDHMTQTMMAMTAELRVVEDIRVRQKAVMLTMTMITVMMMEIRKNIRNLIIPLHIKNHCLKKDSCEI